MKIVDLEIKNIRGIKEIKLTPNEKNFVVWGSNGSGKSAIVDAIDFLLTGRIARLMGAGTGDITLKKHGAHIDCEDLKDAYVKATIKIKGFKDLVIISRSLDKPNQITLTPPITDKFSSIEKIAQRGQHVLTRREILRFITAEGGKRAEEIQALLDLSEIESIRKSIGRVVGDCEKNFKQAQKIMRQVEVSCATRIGQSVFNKDEILKVVNENRKMLGGTPINELKSSFLKSNATAPTLVVVDQSVNTTVLEQDISNLSLVLSEEFNKEVLEKEEILRASVNSIHEDTKSIRAFSNQKLLEIGLSLLDDTGSCPLCDRKWEPGELKTYLEDKLGSAKIVQDQINRIDEISQFISNKIAFLQKSIERVINATSLLQLKEQEKTLITWQTTLKSLASILDDPLYKYHLPPYNSDEVSKLLAPKSIDKDLKIILEKAHNKYQKSTPEQTAWDILTELGVELDQYEKREVELANAELGQTRANLLQEEFEKARDEILGKLYDEVKDRFVDLYRELHQEDEKNFNAILKPSGAALDFKVDFFGRGEHPPHALHSEGHQDSMGVCLFLVLAEKLTTDLIDLIILDDVVMSVDSNHRRNLCGLLAKNFPNKQFLITTHDRTWAMQLRYNGVVDDESLYEFFDWSVDTGPHVNDIVDLWARIDLDIEKDDIPSAAAKLRRGSEQFFAEVCHSIVAKVPFQIDGHFELGDLLSSAMGQFSFLLKTAKNARDSWNDSEQDELDILDNKRREIYKRIGAENWSVNVNVHFNDWANFGKNDFQPIVNSFKDLFELFSCDKCNSIIRVIRSGKDFQNVRCNCDSINWNLVKKKKNK